MTSTGTDQQAPKDQEADVSHPYKSPAEANLRLLLPYVADLELEVDRLRKQGRFVRQEAWAALRRIRQLCSEAAKAGGAAPTAEIDAAAKGLGETLRDLQDVPGYHPSHDQVVVIAVRPLLEQVFRTQQRLEGIEKMLERVNEHVAFMRGVDALQGSSAEAKEAAVAVFYERMTALERQLGRISEGLRLG